MGKLWNWPWRRLNNNLPSPLEPPIRAELFSIERLEAFAQELAASQRVSVNLSTSISITERLKDNGKALADAYRSIAIALAARQQISPAGGWLLDNFHVVDEQVQQIQRDLPPGFYRRLPKLADGRFEGYPRIFEVSWALVAHTDSAFDAAKIIRFVTAFQRIQPLNIGELWALAITLRLTLLENLRRLADAILVQQSATEAADALAGKIFAAIGEAAQTDDGIVTRLAAAPWSAAFAVELVQRLRHQDPGAVPALRWLNERLVQEGSTSEEIVRDQLQWQSSTDVTVRNVITSMRLVAMMNWPEVFESLSLVDSTLRSVSDFASMDFPTRDHYRRAIEELAHQSDLSEIEVARRVVQAAGLGSSANVDKPKSARESDPGHYLINSGRVAFEESLGCRIPFRTLLFRAYSDAGIISYIALIGLLTVGVLGLGLWAISGDEIETSWLLILGLAGFVPASDLAAAIVNRGLAHSIGSRLLPAMELRSGIPDNFRTIIVIPTLLVDAAKVSRLIDRLEDHHLGNRDPNFSFAVISDWVDSRAESDAADQELLNQAVAGIARLNQLYGPGINGARFFLLHRRRIWNEGEGKWIGWERKRGKLRELNKLLRGAVDTTFISINGIDAALPIGIRYVITLDLDTRLPMGSARRLVGKMAHPLNHPEFDDQTGLVIRGHGVLQPRVTPSLPMGSEGSLFQQVFSGPNGLDPYALTISDVYQDLFEEGSFTGKGIYDVDVFEAALKDQFPDSAVLSHDLLEGIFARATLASDIEVVEEFPSRYAVETARQHRWVRGDWQLVPWIFNWPRHPGDRAIRTRIPFMGRWKLLDNLRRSLSAPTALLALFLGWLLPRFASEIWTAFILLTIALPPLLGPLTHSFQRRPDVSLLNHFRTLREDFSLGFMQIGFSIVFLAHHSLLMLDAVSRTLLRVFINRRHLLQWVTSDQTAEDTSFNPKLLLRQMIISAVAFVVFGVFIVLFGHDSLIVAVPLMALWLASPLIAWRVSLPRMLDRKLVLKPKDVSALRAVARRTWRYFETFITAQDNMLPPDNFQETPQPVVAHRTSPTNIGLYLLSVISARDFGWLGTESALRRLEDTFAAMNRLERFRSHFLNWYDTTDLRALEPKYVSAVDSGNLAGYLLALRNACHDIIS
jgi:cyclic beta-1,2-glucan synthetase